MIRKNLFQDNLRGVFLIDILATGVGIIVLLLVLSVSKKVIISKEIRQKKVEEAPRKLEEFIKQGKYPVHADLQTHDYESCYNSAIRANKRRIHTRPILKLFEHNLEIVETGQEVELIELGANDSISNTLNNYLNSINEEYRHRWRRPRVQLHIYSAEWYYPLLAKLNRFNLRPMDYHFFPPVKVPEEYRTIYRPLIRLDSVNQRKEKNGGLEAGVMGPVKQTLEEQLRLRSFLMDTLSGRPNADSLKAGSLLGDSTSNLAGDSLGIADTTLFSGAVGDTIAAENPPDSLSNNTFADRMDSTGASLFPYPGSLPFDSGTFITIEIILSDSSFEGAVGVDSTGRKITGRGSQSPGKSDRRNKRQEVEETDSIENFLADIGAEEGRDQLPLKLQNTENLEYFQHLKESYRIIRKRENKKRPNQKESLYNFLATCLSPFGATESIDEVPLLAVEHLEESRRPYIKIPLYTPINDLELGYNLRKEEADSTTLCIFLKMRPAAFPSGGEPCFIFQGDIVLPLIDSTIINADKYNWIPIGRLVSKQSKNPQKLPMAGYVYGAIEGDGLIIDIEKNGVEILPVMPDYKEKKSPANIWSPLVLIMEIIVILIAVLFLHYNGKARKHVEPE